MRAQPMILIVDDESEVRQLVAEFLESRDYEVITAATGAEAVAAVERDRPDLIPMDIRMLPDPRFFCPLPGSQDILEAPLRRANNLCDLSLFEGWRSGRRWSTRRSSAWR